jgi:hypothetical protein
MFIFFVSQTEYQTEVGIANFYKGPLIANFFFIRRRVELCCGSGSNPTAKHAKMLKTNWYSTRVETKTFFFIFAKSENGGIFAKFRFRENFRYFRIFSYDFFAKNENKFSRNFRENTKTKIFVSTLYSTVNFAT